MAGATRSPVAKDMAALLEQLRAVTDWLADLPGSEFSQPSALPGWDVRALCGHLLLVADGLGRILAAPPLHRTVADQPVPASVLVQRYRRDVDEIEARTAAYTASRTGLALLDHIRSATDQLERLRDTVSLPTVIETPRGPGKLTEFVRTRLVDTVVHADDLSRSLPEREPVPTPRKPLGIACRTLADLLAEQHPGKSVEVRVPPYAAVQCGTGAEGPSHTRGTPPNVVEADPLTFLRLATGRLTWAAANDQRLVAASGQRADLAAVLPVLS